MCVQPTFFLSVIVTVECTYKSISVQWIDLSYNSPLQGRHGHTLLSHAPTHLWLDTISNSITYYRDMVRRLQNNR